MAFRGPSDLLPTFLVPGGPSTLALDGDRWTGGRGSSGSRSTGEGLLFSAVEASAPHQQLPPRLLPPPPIRHENEEFLFVSGNSPDAKFFPGMIDWS